MLKKGIITFLGTAGTFYDKESKNYKLLTEVLYTNNTSISLKEGKYYSAFDVLIDYVKENDLKLTAIYTEESKKSQSLILKQKNKEYYFDDKFLIKDMNNIRDIFKIINEAINEFDEVIFDVTHGFRSLPILSIINMIIENIQETHKITHILFAQEFKTTKGEKYYEFIDLVEYLDIANLSLSISVFLNSLKVPYFKLNNGIYKELGKFSNYLLSNRFKELIESSQKLKSLIDKDIKNLFFINDLIQELLVLLKSIEKVLSKDYYSQFLFFAELFLEKGYFLNASTYMIEGFNYFLVLLLKELNLLDKSIDPNDYFVQNEAVTTFLKIQYNKNYNYPNKYFLDINSKEINRLAKIRDDLAEIRHNLAHINIEKEYVGLRERLYELLEVLKQLNLNDEKNKFIFNDDLKIQTLKYKFEELEKKIPPHPTQNNNMKLSTLMKKFKKNELDKVSPPEYVKKLNKFCLDNLEYYEQLLKYKEQKIFLIE